MKKEVNDLSPVEKLMYETAYAFYEKLGKSPEYCHMKGMNEIGRMAELKKESDEMVWEDITSGKMVKGVY